MFRKLAILVICILMAGCGAGPKAITQATLRDTIFSVEPRGNNSFTIWMTHDDVGAYCTFDKTLAQKAIAIINSPNPEVIITYRSVNTNDPEYNWTADIFSDGCGAERATTKYKLLSIESVAEKFDS